MKRSLTLIFDFYLLQKRYIAYLCVLSFCLSSSVIFADDALFVEAEEISYFQLNEQQKQLAMQHEAMERDYQLLEHDFYTGERIRLFNHTAYQTQDLKAKATGASSGQIGLDDLSISFGYGLEYKVNKSQRIGYEYISTFPYDRGEMVRLFWYGTF